MSSHGCLRSLHQHIHRICPSCRHLCMWCQVPLFLVGSIGRVLQQSNAPDLGYYWRNRACLQCMWCRGEFRWRCTWEILWATRSSHIGTLAQHSVCRVWVLGLDWVGWTRRYHCALGTFRVDSQCIGFAVWSCSLFSIVHEFQPNELVRFA